eukprot:Gb_04395 [translate_table: standard]
MAFVLYFSRLDVVVSVLCRSVVGRFFLYSVVRHDFISISLSHVSSSVLGVFPQFDIPAPPFYAQVLQLFLPPANGLFLIPRETLLHEPITVRFVSAFYPRVFFPPSQACNGGFLQTCFHTDLLCSGCAKNGRFSSCLTVAFFLNGIPFVCPQCIVFLTPFSFLFPQLPLFGPRSFMDSLPGRRHLSIFIAAKTLAKTLVTSSFFTFETSQGFLKRFRSTASTVLCFFCLPVQCLRHVHHLMRGCFKPSHILRPFDSLLRCNVQGRWG